MAGLIPRVLARGLTRVPGLRRLPVLKLLAIAEIAILAHDHVTKLDAQERHRLFELLKLGRGRTSTLTPDQREELAVLVAKAEPRLFAGLAADKLSPVPLPKRFVHGPKRPSG
jgi:hypothetical protein